jgi:peptide deformylase
MNLIKETSELLTRPMPAFDFANPIMPPQELIDEMQKVRKENGGVGLAAPQVGVETRVLVIGAGNFDTEGTEDFNKAFFNPSIKYLEGEESYMIEGCLTFPGLFVKIKRPDAACINYFDQDGVNFEEIFTGMTSRILQHEIDHLDGILFTSRANRVHLDKAKKDRKLSERRRKKLNGRG